MKTHARRLRALRGETCHLALYAGVMGNAQLPAPPLGSVWIVNKTRWPVAPWCAHLQRTGMTPGGIILQ